MKNIAISVRFDGTAYHGWQLQKNAVSVQEAVGSAIERLTGEKPFPELVGCGRTDAGVHANDYVASFKTETAVPVEKFQLAIVSFLPPDISVRRARAVPEDFHARFSCVKKEYVYKIYHANVPDPFRRDRELFHPYPLNAEIMARAAESIAGTHDFTAFRASGSAVRNAVRTVYACEVKKTADGVVIRVSADGFLYNMVRIIAGTLLYVSDGKLSAADIPRLIEKKDRTLSGVTLAPHGLYLNRVWYSRRPGLEGIKMR